MGVSSIELENFPIYIKNNSGMVRYVGSIRFAVDEVKAIDKSIYNRNRKPVDDALEQYIDSNTKVFEIMTQDDVVKHQQSHEARKKQATVKENPSIIKLYADKELHWRQAITKIEDIQDKTELIDLWDEGVELGVTKDSAVMKFIRSTIDGLNILE